MELLHEVEPENIIDMSGEEKLLSRINEYYEKTYTDVLTGIYNRRFYEEKLKKSVISAGIAMIDLDDVCKHNDFRRFKRTAYDVIIVILFLIG